MYSWIIVLHVIASILFFAAHGVSVFVMFRLKSTPTVEGVSALLQLSRTALGVVHVTITLAVVTGIWAGLAGGWLRTGWFWTALALIVSLSFAMVPYGTSRFNRIRAAIGLPLSGPGKKSPPREQPDIIEMRRALDDLRPLSLLAIGMTALVVIVWLMVIKPF